MLHTSVARESSTLTLTKISWAGAFKSLNNLLLHIPQMQRRVCNIQLYRYLLNYFAVCNLKTLIIPQFGTSCPSEHPHMDLTVNEPTPVPVGMAMDEEEEAPPFFLDSIPEEVLDNVLKFFCREELASAY